VIAAAVSAEKDPLFPFATRLRREEPLGPRTTIRIGGPAELYFEPEDAADCAAFLRAAREARVGVRVLGSGANVLVSDAGVRGVVLRPSRLKGTTIDGDRVRALSGESFQALVRRTTDAGLAGFEGLGGVPADVGGAVAMNAGGRYGWVSHVLESAELATPEGTVEEVAARDLGMEYRRSRLPEGSVVVAATFRLKAGDRDVLVLERDRVVREKNAVQPTDARSFGCAFQNPPGESAGRLIEAAGLKGLVVGGARISPIHANFLENLGTATFADATALMETMRSKVLERFGVPLVPEVKIWS
jgi:UDP-N-acetylmuramate dehydrogenase